MKTVYLGLGSNLGDRERMLQRAIDEMEGPDLRVARVSPVYETEPQGLRNQRWFLNMVVEAQTELFPMQLLARLRKIETQMGRRRVVPNGPRSIDIDILFYGSAIVKTPKLRIPHLRHAERRFVLQPMVDLAPDFRDPETQRSMRELLAGVAGQGIRKIKQAEAPASPL